MESLYSRLAGQWDVLFPPDSQRVSFLDGLMKRSGARIIEVGCGSGATAISLASLGYSVAASDLDEVMIESARKSAGENVEFSVDDMIHALEKEPHASAFGVFCMGNTLPHLTAEGELDRFFRAAGSALAPGGSLVIQMLNYPRIISMGSLLLPDLQGDGFIFRRKQTFDRDSGLIIFETEVVSGGDSEKRRHNLLPVDVHNLELMVSRAGLKTSGVFADWNRRIFNEQDSWLVSLYTRKAISIGTDTH